MAVRREDKQRLLDMIVVVVLAADAAEQKYFYGLAPEGCLCQGVSMPVA